MFMSGNDISIRAIQHYMYCPHRWGLIDIGRNWAENIFVTKGNLIHKRVHNPDNSYYTQKKKVLTQVPVYNDDFGLFGMTDCLELEKDDSGVEIPGLAGRYHISIVEYKPTKPKNEIITEPDLYQLYAQMLCVEYSFHCKAKTYIYYADVKKRYEISFDDECKRQFPAILDKMRQYRLRGYIPEVRQGQKCSGCSMKDICLPVRKPQKTTIKKRVLADQEV